MSKTIAWAEGTFTNVTEPFTVMLTNEAQQFATDSNRKVTSAQSYYTDIIVIRGSQERTDYTIGNITSGSGITVSKNSKRVTFSVSAGATIGADTGVIEIPITLDGQTVKKQFSWSCGKQGPQGVKGQDGTSVKITSKSVTYQTSTSGTTAPTGTWLTTVPTVNNGQYLWTKTTVQYSDGNKTEAYSVSYKGTNGTNGTSVTVSKTEVTYQVSTSGTTAPTGTWSTTMPTCDQGLYLWTKTYVKYSDGKDTTSYAVSYKGVDGKKFAFNMLRGTNQGSKHWETYYDSSVDGKYSVESFVDEDGTNGVKFICTEKTSRWQYVCFIDYEMIKTLKSATKYVFSCDIKTNVKNGYIKTSLCTGSASNHFADNLATKLKGDNTWEHVVWSFTTYDPLPQVNNQIVYLSSTAVANVGETYIKNLKLTEGTVDTPWAPHPEDLEGRGVSETVQYYLATSQASGVTSSTSGWSTDITTQKITADKKYLWNCYQTKYSDGTSEPISTPKVIGVYGDKGAKGDNAKNLSITPSSQYFKSTDGGKTFAPNTITIKPTIQGEISFGKWQYSIDGGVSFADVVSGQKGLTISNNVLTVSKDSSLYSDSVTMVTFRAVASDSSFYDTCSIAKLYDVTDIEIGGRNLLLNSDKEYIMGYGIPNTTWTDGYAYIGLPTTRLTDEILPQNNAFLLHPEAGKTYTQTIWIETDANIIDLNAAEVSWFTGKYGHVPVAAKIIKLADNSYKLTSTYTVTKGDSDIRLFDILHLFSALDISNSGTYLKFGKLKVEQGNVSTDWTPAPEDVQTAILSTKSEISSVSSKVDKNKQAIEQRVEKTTYQQDLNLVKGDISNANEGLNKWRYEIYPKSLFASEYQGKSTMDVFAKNTNLTPSQTVLINDTDLGKNWAYGDNYIAYALTFVKFSAAKSVAITFKHDDGAHLYLNGKLVGGDETCNTGAGQSLTLSFVKGWNCLEVVLNEKSGGEHIGFGTTISTLTECKLMNCYYGTPVARQSHITNQLVENTTNINGISTKVSKVTSVIGDNGENFTSFKKDYSDFKQTMNGFKTTVGQTYVTKDDFNGLEIGGRNLLLYSANLKNGYYTNIYDTDDETFKGCSVFKVNHAWNGIRPYFNKHITERNVIKAEDVLTYSVYAKTDDTKEIAIMMFNRTMDNNNGQGAIRGNQGELKLSNDWKLYSITFKVTESMLSVDKGLSWFGYELRDNTSSGKYVYFACPKLEKGNKATDWTPAPEDVNGKIVNVETIANQTANKFEWIVKGGDSSSNFTLTDRVADLVAERINFKGLVTFSGLSTDAKSDILNSFEVGGRNLVKKKQIQGIDSAMLNLDNFLKNGTIEFNVKSTNDGFKFDSYDNYEPNSNYVLSYYFTKTNGTITKFGGFHNGKGNIFTRYTVDGIDYESSGYSTESSTVGAIMNDGNRHRVVVCFTTPSSIKADDVVNFTYIQPGRGNNNPNFGVKIEELKLEKGNKATDWTPAPEDYLPQASLVSNWTTNTTWINGGKIYTGSITADKIAANAITADKIATDAIKSRNYISSGGTQGSFLNLSDGSFKSPNLSWDSNGNLIAKNANLSGQITATKGSIGKYKIDGQWLITGSGSTATGIGGNQAFWAGAEDSNSAPFRVGYDGQLVASGATLTNATVSGDITATKGSIGGWNLVDGYLYFGTSDLASNPVMYNAYEFPISIMDPTDKVNIAIKQDDMHMFCYNIEKGSTSDKYTRIGRSYSLNADGLIIDYAHYDNEHTNGSAEDESQLYNFRSRSSYSGDKITLLKEYTDFITSSVDAMIQSNISLFYEGLSLESNYNIELRPKQSTIFSTSDPSKYHAIETTGDIVVDGKIKASNNITASRFVFYKDSFNYIESLEANNTNNIYFHSNGYYSFRVNNEGNWSNETQSVYITERGISVPGEIGLYSQEMSNYVARYYVAGSTKCTAIGNGSYNTRIYGSSVWTQKAVSTSDVRLKQDFQPLDKFEDLYMNLQPVSFKYIDGYDKSEDRYFGLKAQPTEKLFEDMGENPDDYAMFNKFGIDHEDIKERLGHDVDFDEEHGLDYTNMIALNTHMVQKTRREAAIDHREIEILKAENAELKATLQAIMTKLNMQQN